MLKELISVIVPCYNQAIYLPEALDSVLNQTYTYWECIIVNDGSPDNTEEVALDWCKKDDRFKYIKKENGGLSSARNVGLKEAKGLYIQFLDADDLIEREKIELQLGVFNNYQYLDIVYAPVRYFTTDSPNDFFYSISKETEKWQPEIIDDNNKFLCSLISGNIMACNCPLVKKSIIDKVGYFNEQIPSHEDYEFWVRTAIAGGSIRYYDYPNTYALVRIHNASMSNNSFKMRMGFLQVRYLLLKYLVATKKQCGLNVRFQYRAVKKEFVKYYLSNTTNKENIVPYLNFVERNKFKLLKFIPSSLKFQFMMFDKYEIFQIIRKII